MQLWQALILGILQGISELFPVSSLGHTILIPALLGWNIDPQASQFLAFLVALHLATAIALLIFFWRDWAAVLAAYWGSLQRRQLVYDETSKLAWLLVAGTIVVGLVGLVFEKPLQRLFEDPKLYWLVAVLLIINGGVMAYGEYLRQQANRRAAALPPAADPAPGPAAPGAVDADAALAGQHQLKRIVDLSWLIGAGIGAAQALALFPGISRSGVTMVGGLWAGLRHEEAARFTFMLATPVIALAALIKVPDLFKPEARAMLGTTALAALLAGVTAYLSVRWLMRYFRTERLTPFAYYCVAFGLVALVVLLVR
ncbi:MAG TPA: undecaprenyl-diphosphate phosphatase [Chloroflexia bacterium]|nr:undecaprenyl-diphosphate phosphatase [Chloroflexia bacterium]